MSTMSHRRTALAQIGRLRPCHRPVVDRREAECITVLRRMPTDPPTLLAAKLQRRGWIVMEP